MFSITLRVTVRMMGEFASGDGLTIAGHWISGPLACAIAMCICRTWLACTGAIVEDGGQKCRVRAFAKISWWLRNAGKVCVRSVAMHDVQPKEHHYLEKQRLGHKSWMVAHV